MDFKKFIRTILLFVAYIAFIYFFYGHVNFMVSTFVLISIGLFLLSIPFWKDSQKLIYKTLHFILIPTLFALIVVNISHPILPEIFGKEVNIVQTSSEYFNATEAMVLIDYLRREHLPNGVILTVGGKPLASPLEIVYHIKGDYNRATENLCSNNLDVKNCQSDCYAYAICVHSDDTDLERPFIIHVESFGNKFNFTDIDKELTITGIGGSISRGGFTLKVDNLKDIGDKFPHAFFTMPEYYEFNFSCNEYLGQNCNVIKANIALIKREYVEEILAYLNAPSLPEYDPSVQQRFGLDTKNNRWIRLKIEYSTNAESNDTSAKDLVLTY